MTHRDAVWGRNVCAGVLAVVFTMAWPGQAAEAGHETMPAVSASASPVQTIVARMLESTRVYQERLLEYTVARRYKIIGEEGETRSESNVSVEYRAPGVKEFRTVSERGSMVGHMVFRQLEDAEAEGAKRGSLLTPENYTFAFVGADTVNGMQCYMLNVKPRHKDRLLFEGTIWVHGADYAVVKITGRPVKNPSWWIKSLRFERTYQKIGDFWLPVRDETTSQLRLWGRNRLVVEYSNYQIVPAHDAAGRAVANNPRCRTRPADPTRLAKRLVNE